MNPPISRATIASILLEVRERTGVDFSRYRAATVQRRILNRMISVGAGSYDGYLGLLQSSREEAHELLSRLSIKVSRFYRNPSSFDLLRHEVVPALAAEKRAVRVWCAGCGCGEEAYTLAALLDENGVAGTVLATDIDPVALETAARAIYPAEAGIDFPPDLAQRYLVPIRHGRGRLVAVAERLLGRVRFSCHDLLTGAPPAGAPFDLVSCRNVLIYLGGEVRDEVFATLRRGMRETGYLFLGEAEWPPESLAVQTVNRGARLFRAAVQEEVPA